MPTQCSRDRFGYEVVEGRQVVAAFDGGDTTSDAGGLLLGATDRAIGLTARFAACFLDDRAQAQVEHTVKALVAQHPDFRWTLSSRSSWPSFSRRISVPHRTGRPSAAWITPRLARSRLLTASNTPRRTAKPV
jgi:hypothetical protein